MKKKIAWIFAAVFVAIGLAGFVPALAPSGHLLGIFEVGPLHNVIHLLTGIVAALAAWQGGGYPKLFFRVFGVVYALVTVVGFIQGTTVLGLIGVNFADNLLHLAIAAVALFIGFCPCKGKCAMCKGEGEGHDAHTHGDHEHHAHGNDA